MKKMAEGENKERAMLYKTGLLVVDEKKPLTLAFHCKLDLAIDLI